MKNREKYLLIVLSFLVVAFGQPAWSEWLSIAAASFGFALFWRVLLEIPTAKKRFFIALGWYAAVQFVQFSWVLSHPYYYIYPIHILASLLFGIQSAVLALWMTRTTLECIPRLFGLAGLWTLLEWTRLFIFSGLPFNPAGLALTGNILSLQMGSLFGIYGLSFLVIITNLLLLRAWIAPPVFTRWSLPLIFLMFPYFFGWEHLSSHEKKVQKSEKLNVVLVQPAFQVEESLGFQSADEARRYVLNKWRKIFTTLKKQTGKKIDFIALPEYVVPYGTYPLIYPIYEVKELFEEIWGNVDQALPTYETPYGSFFTTDKGDLFLVSNAYIIQTLVNLFQADVLIGLEDSIYDLEKGGKGESYSAAFHFKNGDSALPLRYEKRVLVPMGEYIPFEWCRKWAAKYGVFGSFTCGQEAKVFQGTVPFGFSICYEELFSGLTRENRVKGAELLVNVTNDGWFPQSRLPKQHFDHARLRTVENGIPMVRACNTGITGAIDSLGRVVGVLGDNDLKTQELADSVLLEVPRYHYSTLYSLFGDKPILFFSFGAFFLLFFPRKKNEKNT